MLLLALAGCAPSCECAYPLEIPPAAAVGDELVLALGGAASKGNWADAEDPGTLLEVRVGANRRNVVIPGGVDPALQRVSLGAWDGGALEVEVLAGDYGDPAWPDAVFVDPAAAGTPVLGTYDTAWWNDTPLVVYEEDGLWTWVFTDEDGGTGLLPTLLMASWGRPVDIEGLWDEESGQIQTTDHAWITFDGDYEGTHPLFEVVTYNGMIGPLDEAPYLLSPVPVDFTTEGGAVPRERVLDAEPWVLAASWAEARREGIVAEDGGQDDYLLGEPDEYLFVDYDVSSGARVSFEADVAETWWSSLNGLGTSGLTDATVGGRGRTCIELPPGTSPSDVSGLRVRSYGGAGSVTARWFRYGADDFTPQALGEVQGVALADGGTAVLW